MDDAALLKAERLVFHAKPGARPMIFRVILWVVGGITLLHGLVPAQVSTTIAAVALVAAGWFLGRFGEAGTIVDRKRRQVPSFDGQVE